MCVCGYWFTTLVYGNYFCASMRSIVCGKNALLGRFESLLRARSKVLTFAMGIPEESAEGPLLQKCPIEWCSLFYRCLIQMIVPFWVVSRIRRIFIIRDCCLCWTTSLRVGKSSQIIVYNEIIIQQNRQPCRAAEGTFRVVRFCLYLFFH